MKTNEILKCAEIIRDGQVIETVEIKNPCQMWRNLDAWFEKHGKDVEIRILREDGTAYKDFTIVTLKSGKTQKVNSIKETNRWMMLKAAGKVTTKKDQKAAEEAKKAAEAAKAEAKKAKKREYDKTRRARLKAEKAAAVAVA